MPKVHSSGNARVVIDDRYMPVIISQWRGQATLELARWHAEHTQAMLDECIRNNQKYVLVSDASLAERPPPAVRKFFAEFAESGGERQQELALASIIVISSAIMRGALTAVGWVSERAARMDTVATMQVGLERALKALDAAGLERPAGLDPKAYALPEADEAH